MLKLPLLLASVALPFLLGSCASMYMKDHGFRETPAVEVNGAQVQSALKPMGRKAGIAISAMIVAGGTGTLDGPFLWRVEAEGVHEYLRVNKIRVTTKTTNRDEWYPRANLGINAKFKKIPGEKGKAFAQYQIPGKLTVMPREDGKVIIHLNVSVKASGVVKSKWIKFTLEPESKWKSDTVFLPTEIVKSVRGNPREWNW
ncbi:hypothetical protein N9221_00025 [Akkermansiaceae bacterium]|nr:hypothetical protein [Akkermansiaceae bacterium]MDA8875833.1 hypothetical protein [Akkermansiaceae bacterium]MDA8967359.1 hypothetical protein [Akkermansiaceae bacterium]MDB4505029.1 hypothetical protein [Akkermansiaceae bacterium]